MPTVNPNKCREFAINELARSMGNCLGFAGRSLEITKMIVDDFIGSNFPLGMEDGPWTWDAALNEGFESAPTDDGEYELFAFIGQCYVAAADLHAVTCAMGLTEIHTTHYFIDALDRLLLRNLPLLENWHVQYIHARYQREFAIRLKDWLEHFESNNSTTSEVNMTKVEESKPPEMPVRNEDVRLIADAVTCVVNKLRIDAVENELSEEQWTALMQSIVTYLKGFRVKFGTVVPPAGE